MHDKGQSVGYEKYRIIAIVGIIIVIVSFLNFITSMFSFNISRGLISFVGFPIGGILAAIYNKKYANAVKDEYVLDAYKQYFSDIEYVQKGGYSKEQINQLELFDTGDSYLHNDWISSNYKGVSFSQFDAIASTTTGTGDDSSTTYHFVGQVYTFKFNKKFNYYHKLISKKGSRSTVQRKFNNAKKMTFDDDRFNQAFRSLSNNELEAFYIFTPQFMEVMVKLRDSLKGGLTVVLKEGSLYLAVYSNKDSHEPSLFKGVTQKYRQDIINSILLIQRIINDLDLEHDYFYESTSVHDV